MVTIKAYTDLEQSKKLAEILPLESADMYYSHEFVNSAGDYYKINIASEGHFDDKELSGSDITAWSLAALLSVLPSVIKRNGKRMFLTLEKAGAYNLYYKSPDRLDELWETKEEYIDACVAMIESLHELKML